MSETVPVVKIKPSHESQGDFVEINEADFDASKHELYEPAKKKRGKQAAEGEESAAEAAE